MNDRIGYATSLSPKALAELHGALKKQGTPALIPEIQRIERAGPLPLSFAQERLWFLDQWEPASPLYNLSAAVQLSGPVSAPLLEMCMNDIVQRHETLRTTFELIGGQPVQQIASQLKIPITTVSLETFRESERTAEAQRLTALEARRPFNLKQGPLLRIMLLRLAPANHVLVLNLHHIVSDGWSMSVLFRELSALYEAYSTGQRSPLPELAIQYADFAQWQRQYLQGPVLNDQLDWWREQLRGVPSILLLPADRSRPATPAFHGSTEILQLSTLLTEDLKRLGRQANATLFMVVLAAFAVLLARYTGEHDIVVGTPIANRTRAELESLIGFFVNTLVLRTDLGGNPSFRELLARVRENTLGAYAHQDLPFERLVQELQPERSPGHNPLFQVMLALQNAPGGESMPSAASSAPSAINLSRFDLALSLAETREGLSGAIEYSTDLFEAERMRRLAGHFQVLLEAAVANPSQRVWELPLLSDTERRQMVVEWNRSEAAYPPACLHQLFEAQVERTPEAVAVVAEGRECSYRELNERANRLAHYLRKQGVGPESLVGICLERSPEMVQAVLAVLKAGAAYLPIDPDYPQERRKFMLDHADCAFLITADVLRRDRDAIEHQSSANLANVAHGNNAAYAIYTSGSTGQPKAVLVQHSGLANLAATQTRVYSPGLGSRILQFSSLSFDASIFEITLALANGGALYIGSRQDLTPGPALARFLRDNQISIAVIPPSLLAVTSPESLFDLKTLIVAGEACSPNVVARWGSSRRFSNAYGPTEATVWATVFECTNNGEIPPIGRPIGNVRCYVLDEYLAPVPIGVTGELVLAGAGLARGYLNRPDLTAELFVPDPYSLDPGSRMYRTGDLVRYLPDGNLQYFGRSDYQVKLRGLRIEVEEVEAALRRLPSVRDAAVAVAGQGASQYLVAYVVGETGPPVESDLRRELAGVLPEYLLPATFRFLDALPSGPNGKFNRKALPTLTEAVSQVPDYVSPRNQTEEILTNIWKELLGVDRVGIHDNFFARGGHSLLAMRVVSAVRDAFSVELPVRRLFESPTVAALAEVIAQTQKSEFVSTVGIARVPRESRRTKLGHLRVEHAS